ncbi:phage head morphogenesis protein [Nocardia sp. NBC_01388]|uniref:phage head morphogenesis protein n=1 Tax=Nocardia sp. NBC_01388 TaxID=2903596 RepID=UPI003250AD05
MITIADIDRWNVADIDRVFAVCSAQADHCTERNDDLSSLQTFQTWGGGAADAAKVSVGKTRVDFDAHGTHVATIADAAKTASSEVASVKKKLTELRTTAQQQGLRIGDNGTVAIAVYGPYTKEAKAKLDANRAALQLELNQLLINAQMVDDDLAAAINGADGQMNESEVAKHNHPPVLDAVFGLGSLGLPEYPDGSLTSEETRNYYAAGEQRLKAINEQLANSDLSLEERTKIALELRNELRTKARDLMADRDAAAYLAEKEPNSTLEQLIDRKMERKGLTREGALEDIIKSSSESRGSVNQALGVDPDNPKLPDPQEVRARVGASPGVDPPGVELGAGSRALRVAGKAALPLAAAYEAWDGYTQVKAGTESIPEAVGSGAGAVGGMWAGAEIGAAAGAFGGPVGAAAGAVLGGVIGGLGGGQFGKTIGGWFS